MPETTETASFARPQDEVFRYLADFGNLAEWDPSFEESRRLDDGPLRVGARFHAVISAAGNEIPMELEITEYDEPRRVSLTGSGDGFDTSEDITVEPTDEGCEVTYHSRFETEKSDLLDAAAQPAFWAVGKAAMRGMKQRLGTD